MHTCIAAVHHWPGMQAGKQSKQAGRQMAEMPVLTAFHSPIVLCTTKRNKTSSNESSDDTELG